MPGGRGGRGRSGRGSWVLAALLLASALSGCAASRTEVSGTFSRSPEKNLGAPPVNVFFLFRHEEQQHGFDAIPKLKSGGVKDFNNLFRDALGELSNVGQYETFTDQPNDVNDPERRKKREGLRAASDYTLAVRFFEESSFRQQCLSGTISLLTLTIVPMPYSWDYTISADLYDKGGRLVSSYQRQATLSNWVEVLLMFAYPFHPLEGKREEIYAESLHDIFRQIESEKVLR